MDGGSQPLPSIGYLEAPSSHIGKNPKSIENHINAALELDLPLIVHSRNAEEDTYDILKSEKKNSNLKFIVHCFYFLK